MTYTTEQAGTLAQIFLVMLIATALNMRFEGLARTKGDRWTFYLAYGTILLAVTVSTFIALLGFDLPPDSPLVWLILTANTVALIFGIAALAGQILAIIRGIRAPVKEPEIGEPAQDKEDDTENNLRRWSIHLEYRHNGKPAARRERRKREQLIQPPDQPQP